MRKATHTTLTTRLTDCATRVGGKRALAQKTGISEAQIFRYLHGKNELPVDRLLLIAKAAGVDNRWLLDGTGSVEQEDNPQPSFRPALISSILRLLDELMLEYEKPFTPAQKAHALTFMYQALRHEEILHGQELEISKASMLSFVHFLDELRSEDILRTLTQALQYFEYQIHDTQPAGAEFAAFTNYICRAYMHVYNSPVGQAYFDRLGTQILPDSRKRLDDLIQRVQKLRETKHISVLDVGCGNGRELSYLHRAYDNLTPHGLEISTKGHVLCQTLIDAEKLPQNCIKHGDMRTLPYAAKSIDLVMSRQSFYCLPYIPNSGVGADEFLEDAHRVLKPRGVLYILSRYGEGQEYLPYCQLHTQESITDLAEQHGFRLLQFKRYNTATGREDQLPAQHHTNKYDDCFITLLQKI